MKFDHGNNQIGPCGTSLEYPYVLIPEEWTGQFHQRLGRRSSTTCILLSCWPGPGCYSPQPMLYQSQSINPSTILLHSSRDRLRVQLIRSRRPLGAQRRHQPRDPRNFSSVPVPMSQTGGQPAWITYALITTLIMLSEWTNHRPAPELSLIHRTMIE